MNTVRTFFASDIEGSTRLWESQQAAMSQALNRHDTIMRSAIERQGGLVFKTVGDGFFASFDHVFNAVAAIVEAQTAIAAEPWPTDRPIRVRMALHVGPAEVRDADFFGPTINRLARLLSIGHGGQVLLSGPARQQALERMPEGTGLRDMGRHRLKDLENPEEVSMLLHEVLGTEFPALKSLDSLPNNLPRQVTSFVGREDDRRAVAELIGQGAAVTLTGAGGTGKSRLAIQVAAERLEEFRDGVWLIELGALTDDSLVPQAVAHATGIRETGSATVTRAVVDGLREKETLLLLDNCEHLVDAVASLVDELTRSCPKLKVLATSREALNIPGEQIYRVPALSLGSGKFRTAAEALEFDAVRLFVDRARQSDPRFELVDRLATTVVNVCRRLDGIPLAIELAASRVKVMSLDQLSGRLEDRFRILTGGARTALPRHQTLRATIDWSFDLLDEPDRVLLRRVSAFAGGWTLEAAEQVCADDTLESWEVMDGLMRLVEKSLVVLESGDDYDRYRLLESVREYGSEKLTGDEAAEVRDRHARFYANLVIQAENGLLGPDQLQWLETLEREHDNIRATLAYSRTRPDLCVEALKLVGAIGRFWTVRGYFTEGRDWIESLIAAAPAAPTIEKASAWRTAGQLAYWQGDSKAGRRFGEASLEICKALGDEDGETKSLFRLGFACLSEGDLPAARQYFEAALALGIKINDVPGIPHLMNAVGEVTLAEEDYPKAKEIFDEALRRFRAQNDRRSIASVLKNLAIIAIHDGEFATAFTALTEGLPIRMDLGNLPGVAATLDTFGILAAAEGRAARAVMLLSAANALHLAHGSHSEPAEARRIDEIRAEADAKLGTAHFDQLWQAGQLLELEAAIKLAESNADPASEPALLG